MKIVRVRNTFQHNKYIMMVATSSADTEASKSGETGGDGNLDDPRRKLNKTKYL